ncbi:hypothetical protein WAI453_006421 [Rhynchosporium graminicola]
MFLTPFHVIAEFILGLLGRSEDIHHADWSYETQSNMSFAEQSVSTFGRPSSDSHFLVEEDAILGH